MWLRPGDFLERPQNEDSRHTRTLTQRTDSAKRRQRQTEPKKREHFPPPTYFFPDSLTKLRVWSGPAGCLVAGSSVAVPALRPLCCHGVAQTRFGRGVGNSLDQTSRNPKEAANPLFLFFPPSSPRGPSSPGPGQEKGWMDLEARGAGPWETGRRRVSAN